MTSEDDDIELIMWFMDGWIIEKWNEIKEKERSGFVGSRWIYQLLTKKSNYFNRVQEMWFYDREGCTHHFSPSHKFIWYSYHVV